MNFVEILKANNVADDVIKAIQDAMKANNVYTASEENLDIRYGKLKTDHEGLKQQHAEASNLIKELQTANKGNESLQSKVSEYETKIAQLDAELMQTKLEAAIKVELLANKALDVDYLSFKLKEKGELALDENGKIKGWDDKLAGLKTQFPTQFEAAGKKQYIPNKLPENVDNGGGLSRETLLKKPYAERMRLYSENPDAYKEAMKG